MKWRDERFESVSDCGRYAIRGSWAGRHFEWRGRHIETDHLVCASADLDQVKGMCERHAALIDAEVPA